jgi:hypothetical protein
MWVPRAWTSGCHCTGRRDTDKRSWFGCFLSTARTRDAKDVYGWTPWRRALDEGHVEVVQVLFQHSPAASSQSKSKSTLLHEASGGGDVEFARTLLNYGADASAREQEQLDTITLGRQLGGHMESRSAASRARRGCKYLRTEDESTPLHYGVAKADMRKSLGRFSKHGADASAPDEEQHDSTALGVVRYFVPY